MTKILVQVIHRTRFWTRFGHGHKMDTFWTIFAPGIKKLFGHKMDTFWTWTQNGHTPEKQHMLILWYGMHQEIPMHL